jgi:hypothetical protein
VGRSKTRGARLAVREARLITKELRQLGVPPQVIAKIWAWVICDNQDLTLHTMLSDGVATVRQTLFSSLRQTLFSSLMEANKRRTLVNACRRSVLASLSLSAGTCCESSRAETFHNCATNKYYLPP